MYLDIVRNIPKKTQPANTYYCKRYLNVEIRTDVATNKKHKSNNLFIQNNCLISFLIWI